MSLNRQQRRQAERSERKATTADPRLNEKVAVAYPHDSVGIDPRFHRCLFRLGILDAYGALMPDGTRVGGWGRIGGGGAHLPRTSGAVVARARNNLVRDFLDLDQHKFGNEDVCAKCGVSNKDSESACGGTIDWLWFIDADMTFEPHVLEQLLAVAHPTERPIVGGLCFAYMADKPRKFVPTLYSFVPASERLVRLTQYPPDTLIPVAATGAACLLIHRSVLVAMREKFPPPRPWFTETPFYERDEHGDPIMETGDEYSEDLTFCLRAQGCGFPVFVHTGIKLGHVKHFEADEAGFLAEAAMLHESIVPRLPTFVVIPVKAGERDEMTAALVSVLSAQVPAECIRCDDSDLTITEKWNAGLVWAADEAAGAPHNVAVLNNDLDAPLEFLARLESGLRQDEDNWIAYPGVTVDGQGRAVHGDTSIPNGVAATFENPSMAGQTIAGWAFMVRGESGLRFDDQFRFWYSDSDIEKQVRAAGRRAVAVGGCVVKHLHPMESSRSPELVAVIREDERRFADKWGLDPESLWLARNPGFGAVPVAS